MATGGEHDKPTFFQVIDGRELMIEVVWDVNARILFRRHLFGKASETVEDADNLRGRAQRLLERNLPDAPRGEGVISDHGRLRGHHQRQSGIENGLAIERTELSAEIAAYAKRILAPDIERDARLQRAAVLLEEPDHAAEMIVVSMAEDHRIECGRLDPDDRHVVVEDLGREAEIDQDVALLAAAERLGVKRQPPLGVQNAPRRTVRVAVRDAPFDRQALACLFWHEQLSEIVRDDAYCKSVNFWDIAAQRLGRACARIGGERRHNCADKARAAGAQGGGGRCKRWSAITRVE